MRIVSNYDTLGCVSIHKDTNQISTVLISHRKEAEHGRKVGNIFGKELTSSGHE